MLIHRFAVFFASFSQDEFCLAFLSLMLALVPAIMYVLGEANQLKCVVVLNIAFVMFEIQICLSGASHFASKAKCIH